jgi:hypothetical protein
MATHPSVAVLEGVADKAGDIITAIGTVTGVTVNGRLGCDGVTGGITTRPMLGVAGVAVTIDDATYVDPDDGSLGAGAAVIHTGHFPGGNPGFVNEARGRGDAA